MSEEHLYRQHREEVMQKYRKAAMAREEYLLRRQRKEVLEKCRRVAIVGASADPNSASYGRTLKLLGLGLEVIPIAPGCESYLGVRCFASLGEVPGAIDILQVYPREGMDLMQVAGEAVEKKVKAFWIEEGHAGPEVKELLADGGIQVVEHESLEMEYAKHFPFAVSEPRQATAEKKAIKVRERMTKSPVTVRPEEPIQGAMDKMRRGHFRHLPVVDDRGKPIGILSDRDIRLIRPSRAFVSEEDEALQLWSTAVRQAAVFDPVTIYPEASLEQAVELMLRWEIGGLPVVNHEGKLIGILTYADVLREFLARENEA